MSVKSVGDLIKNHSLPESEYSYLGKARLVHFHVDSKTQEFLIPRYHYNFISGINILDSEGAIKKVTITLSSTVKQTKDSESFISVKDINEIKIDKILEKKNLLQDPIYLSENVDFKLNFDVEKKVTVPVLIEYAIISVEELIKISESKYILQSRFNNSDVFFKNGFIYSKEEL